MMQNRDALQGTYVLIMLYYADYVCLVAPRALVLQNLLEMCYSFNQDNDFMFNFLKFVYVVSRPKKYILLCQLVYLHRESRIHETK